MPKRRRAQPVLQPHRPHAHSFNFVSGFIYAGAVIASVALGAIFYKSYRDAHQPDRISTPSDALSMDLPPGAKVLTKSGQQKIVTKPPAPPRPTPAKPQPDTREVPVAAATPAPDMALPPPAESHELPPGEFPPLKPLPPTPWTANYGDILTPETHRLVPSSILPVSIAPRKETLSDLPLRGNEEFLLMRFDLSHMRGWTIKRAVWHARISRGTARDLSFSSVLSDWNPKTGQFQDLPENRPVTLAAVRPNQPLPWNGWRFLRGHGASQIFYSAPAELHNAPGEWISVELDPKLVQALVADASYGIAICDEKGQARQTLAISGTNEADNASFFEVEGALADMVAPGEISHLQAWAHPALARPDRVGALLTWTATGDNGHKGQAFKYDIRYAADGSSFTDARKLPLADTPFPQPAGQKDQAIIDGLQPNLDYTFFIRAVDEAGQPGPVSRVSLHSGESLKLPAPGLPSPKEASEIEVASRAASLWIVDEAAGVNPLTGKMTRQGYPETETLGQPSFLWDRSTRTLNLQGAGQETIGFQIVFGRKTDAFPNLLLSTAPFRKASGEAAALETAFYRVWYSVSEPMRGGARMVYGDALTPLKGPVKMPWEVNAIPNQMYQSIYAEIKIPAGLAEGLYQSQLVITAPNGNKDAFNILLDVLPVTLPDVGAFQSELLVPAGLAALYRKNPANNEEALPVEQAYRELANAHRTALSILPYKPTGQCVPPFSPPVSGKGSDARVDSWTDWDQRFGSALTQKTTAYQALPICESWPVPFGDGYVCEESDIRQAGTGARVYGGSPDTIAECMSTTYWQTFRAMLRQFGEHFKAGGWTRVPAGLWLLNEPSTNYAGRPLVWSLGHPLYRDDFLALDAFAQAAAAEADSFWPANVFTLRVSVPEAGLLGSYGGPRFRLLSSSDPTADGWALLRKRAAMYDAKLWLESETVPLNSGLTALQSLGIGFFLEGADGWSIRETAGPAENWLRARDAAFFYCGAPQGSDAPQASLRLKLLRRTLQDIELLSLLQEKNGWTREQLKDFVQTFMKPLRGGMERAENWQQLRLTVLDLLGHNLRSP